MNIQLKIFLREFLIEPLNDYSKNLKYSWKDYLIIFVLLELVIFFPLSFVFTYFISSEKIEDHQDISKLSLLLLTLIIIPIIEETIFRLPLTKKKLSNWIVLTVAIFSGSLSQSPTFIVSVVFVLILFFSYSGGYISYKNTIFLSSILFALSHLDLNDFSNASSFMLLPFSKMSQFVFSVFAGIIIREGFLKVIMYHSLCNLVVIGLMLLFEQKIF